MVSYDPQHGYLYIKSEQGFITVNLQTYYFTAWSSQTRCQVTSVQ